MKKVMLFTSGLVFLISCLILIFTVKSFKTPGVLTNNAKTYEIKLTPQGFEPNEMTIKHGDYIKFTTGLNEPFWPASDLHPTHGIYPEFDPQEPIEPSQSWTFQFLKSGRWKFHDHLNPTARGIISVL